MKEQINTRVLPVSAESVALAARLIREGEVVAFPTETVYGLGANALDAAAVAKIFQAKGRPQDNPLIVHIFTPEQLMLYGRDIDERCLKLAGAFWPGPLTMVVRRAETVPGVVCCGLDTVGIRCPQDAGARALLETAGLPIAAPSANISGRPSPTTARHVLADLNGKIPLILDGGACRVGVESTVISMAGPVPVLLRPGIISRGQIEAVIGEISVSPAVTRQVSEDMPVQSPGMKYRHYAPRAAMTVVNGELAAAAEYINRFADAKTGILCFAGEAECFSVGQVIELGPQDDAHALSHNLFAALRSFDEMDVRMIFARLCRNDGEFSGVYNRLCKAAGFNVIRV